jgi:cytochrome c-type biogenesis protein CcmH
MIPGRLIILVAVAVGVLAGPVRASGELRLEDPVDMRLRSVASQLRCPVCQSEALYDSQSSMARQMKDRIREQILEGRTDEEIKAFFVARYGEFMLLEPRRAGSTLFIWIAPGVVLAMAGLGVAGALWRRSQLSVELPNQRAIGRSGT